MGVNIQVDLLVRYKEAEVSCYHRFVTWGRLVECNSLSRVDDDRKYLGSASSICIGLLLFMIVMTTLYGKCKQTCLYLVAYDRSSGILRWCLFDCLYKSNYSNAPTTPADTRKLWLLNPPTEVDNLLLTVTPIAEIAGK